jgi:hypothetical protein
MMTSIRAKPTRRTAYTPWPGDASRDDCHDPAGLSDTLRELAVMAHRAVRSAGTSTTRPGVIVGLDSDSHQELVKVHARIIQFQRILQAQSLHGLVPYVSALRRKVEDQLYESSSRIASAGPL